MFGRLEADDFANFVASLWLIATAADTVEIQVLGPCRGRGGHF